MHFRVVLPHGKKVVNLLLHDKHWFILLPITFPESHRNDEDILGQVVASQTYKVAALLFFHEKFFTQEFSDT